MVSPGEDTLATKGGGVTSAILSACKYLVIMAWMFDGRSFVHKVRRKSEGTDGPGVSGGEGGTELISCHPSPPASEAGGLAALPRVTRLISPALIRS